MSKNQFRNVQQITPYNNRLLQWLRLGVVKNGREKTNRRKKLNISDNTTPLKASDRNVMPHPKTHRTFKHIWFFQPHKSNTKNQKSLNFFNARKNPTKNL